MQSAHLEYLQRGHGCPITGNNHYLMPITRPVLVLNGDSPWGILSPGDVTTTMCPCLCCLILVSQ